MRADRLTDIMSYSHRFVLSGGGGKELRMIQNGNIYDERESKEEFRRRKFGAKSGSTNQRVSKSN